MLLEIIREQIARALSIQKAAVNQQHMADLLGITKGRACAWERGQRPNADDLETIARKLYLSGHWLLLGEGDPEGQAQPATPPIEHPVAPFVTRLQGVIRSLHETDAPNEVIREAILALLRNPQPPPPPTAPGAAAAIPGSLKTDSAGRPPRSRKAFPQSTINNKCISK
ncbi:MAG TPA: hypothetical protein VE028_09975 [Nitratidesulfovibrio sp.]|nr:hypothetical protein [Nitratidesulfovibrio sp.]